MEPRLVLAYSLIALLILAAGVGLWFLATVRFRRQRRDDNRERARRARRPDRAAPLRQD